MSHQFQSVGPNGVASLVAGDSSNVAGVMERDSSGDTNVRRIATPASYGGLPNLGFLYAGIVIAGQANATMDEANVNGLTATIDCTAAPQTFTGPAASGCAGKLLAVVKIDSTVNALLVDMNVSDTFAGRNVFHLLSQWDCALMHSDGAQWVPLAISRNPLVYSIQAVSSAVTGTATETTFSNGSYTFPANALVAGSVIEVEGQGIVTGHNGSDTLTVKLYIGSTAILTTGAVNTAANQIFTFRARIDIRTVGAGGTLVGFGSQILAAEGTAETNFKLASTAVDTTATQAIACKATWSSTSGTNSCRLDYLAVKLLR